MSHPQVKRVVIGNDHGGVEAKFEILRLLRERGIEAVNVGTDTPEICRYPHYARKVAGAVARGEADRGILICSTGIGMSIAANKIKGIRAALCTSTYMAKMTRQHNDSNVLCLGGKITGIDEILDIVATWLDEAYTGGRHDISLGILAEQEAEYGLRAPQE
jgi:ribose 5-phosphate isomerase B